MVGHIGEDIGGDIGKDAQGSKEDLSGDIGMDVGDIRLIWRRMRREVFKGVGSIWGRSVFHETFSSACEMASGFLRLPGVLAESGNGIRSLAAGRARLGML